MAGNRFDPLGSASAFVYSFYGYTDRIDNYVVADNERVNLNLVITYDEEKDVTHVIWATPFLNEDFSNFNLFTSF